jgi:glycosyltransferase involved in cell wall biosynthesis
MKEVNIKPLVSVMLCTNTVDEYFDRALFSVQTQSLQDIEILIAANGLTPEQEITLRESVVHNGDDLRIKILTTQMSGVTFSRNLALHAASADLIAVLDADDVAYRDRLQIQYDYMVAHPSVMVLGSQYDTIDQQGNKLSVSELPLENQAIRQKLIWANPICHPTTMIRKEAALAVGGYTGGLAQDYELWLSLMAKTETQFANLPETLIGYREPVVSKARRSRRAYAQVASAQWRQFAMTKSPSWFAASVISVAKAWFRSRQG